MYLLKNIIAPFTFFNFGSTGFQLEKWIEMSAMARDVAVEFENKSWFRLPFQIPRVPKPVGWYQL